jgi:small subunit ribosomal protein S13
VRTLSINKDKDRCSNMARISGVDLPANKKVLISLTYIFGIGLTKSKSILKTVKIDPDTKTHALSEEQILDIRNELSDKYIVEGELRSVVGRNIKRLVDIGTYKGMRHKKGLPVNGQNTKNNSRTRKGKKRTVANKKKAI